MTTAAVDHEGRLEGLLKERMGELARKLVGATSSPSIPPASQLAQQPSPTKKAIPAQVEAPKQSSRMPMYIARSVLFLGAIGGGVAGYLLDQDAEDMSKDYHPINTSQGRQYQDDITDAETKRNIAWIIGGVLAVGGAVTFAF